MAWLRRLCWQGPPLVLGDGSGLAIAVGGGLMLAGAPSRCPTCNAWPATFRHFGGIFNVDNPDPLASLALLAQGPEFGRVTLLQQVGYFAYHEAFHYPDFVEKRRQLGVTD